MEDILNNLIKLPFVTKVAALAGAIVAMTAVNYFVWPGISGIYDKTKRTERTLATLQEDLDKKQAIANHLNQYRKELEAQAGEYGHLLDRLGEGFDIAQGQAVGHRNGSRAIDGDAPRVALAYILAQMRGQSLLAIRGDCRIESLHAA